MIRRKTLPLRHNRLDSKRIMSISIYVTSQHYRDMLDNLLVHIYHQSCGFMVTICMSCEKIIRPSQDNWENDTVMSIYESSPSDGYGYESYFFLVCADCRIGMEDTHGMIPDRKEQRRMIERMIEPWEVVPLGHRRSKSNPNIYANIYVIAVENPTEIILLYSSTRGKYESSSWGFSTA